MSAPRVVALSGGIGGAKLALGLFFGPTLSFKGLENGVYYMLADGGSRYKNYTGCGNTLNADHPAVRELVLEEGLEAAQTEE